MISRWLDRWAAMRVLLRLHESREPGAKTNDELFLEAFLWLVAGDDEMSMRFVEAQADA